MAKRPKVALGLKHQQKLDAVAAEQLQTGKRANLSGSSVLSELKHRGLIDMSLSIHFGTLAEHYDGRRLAKRWAVWLTPKGWRAVNERLRAMKRLRPTQDMIAF